MLVTFLGDNAYVRAETAVAKLSRPSMTNNETTDKYMLSVGIWKAAQVFKHFRVIKANFSNILTMVMDSNQAMEQVAVQFLETAKCCQHYFQFLRRAFLMTKMSSMIILDYYNYRHQVAMRSTSSHFPQLVPINSMSPEFLAVTHQACNMME